MLRLSIGPRAGERVSGARPISNQSMLGFDSAAFAYALSGKLCRVALEGRTEESSFMSKPLTRMTKAISIESAMGKSYLARQMLLYRREGRVHRRTAQCVSAGDCQSFAFKRL